MEYANLVRTACRAQTIVAVASAAIQLPVRIVALVGRVYPGASRTGGSASETRNIEAFVCVFATVNILLMRASTEDPTKAPKM